MVCCAQLTFEYAENLHTKQFPQVTFSSKHCHEYVGNLRNTNITEFKTKCVETYTTCHERSHEKQQIEVHSA
jgi:hypothetical protein